ncbi:tripartite tricarboxylate transporter TctB family protein [Agrococcus lahaulensis]|uniref:tripartite tricarboxylate transporter TctB family protein n=1 Tax=Agrococcus sp. BE272 TaxID=2817727 RepID=UPI000FE2A732|nr:tripartite tricarboxylate transporter TctB family protein [Agrococcus sp. BE272]MDR7233301.1 putative tricarboxylic transport membrane protein [Agrococcus sp. BE272]RWR18969.1 tripartite tricarboxylate transporter TctB family protein [Agrococcus lahaulensis]
MSTAPAGAPTGASAAARSARIEAMVFVGLLVVLAIAVLISTTTIREPPGSTNTLGARVVPYAVGGLLLLSSLVVLVGQLRGRFGHAEEGEDIDLEHGTSWGSTGIVVLSFLSLMLTIPHLGWPLGVAILFTGASLALGAKRWWLATAIGLALGVVTQLVFGTLLGLSLPATGTLTSWIGL